MAGDPGIVLGRGERHSDPASKGTDCPATLICIRPQAYLHCISMHYIALLSQATRPCKEMKWRVLFVDAPSSYMHADWRPRPGMVSMNPVAPLTLSLFISFPKD